jgi:hypothetical protein
LNGIRLMEEVKEAKVVGREAKEANEVPLEEAPVTTPPRSWRA